MKDREKTKMTVKELIDKLSNFNSSYYVEILDASDNITWIDVSNVEELNTKIQGFGRKIVRIS